MVFYGQLSRKGTKYNGGTLHICRRRGSRSIPTGGEEKVERYSLVSKRRGKASTEGGNTRQASDQHQSGHTVHPSQKKLGGNSSSVGSNKGAQSTLSKQKSKISNDQFCQKKEETRGASVTLLNYEKNRSPFKARNRKKRLRKAYRQVHLIEQMGTRTGRQKKVRLQGLNNAWLKNGAAPVKTQSCTAKPKPSPRGESRVSEKKHKWGQGRQPKKPRGALTMRRSREQKTSAEGNLVMEWGGALEN